MTDHIADRFNAFLQYITLSDGEKMKALEQGRILSQRLEQRPEVYKCLITGSMVRTTAIRKYSDVDIVAVIDSVNPLTQADSAVLVRAVADMLRETESHVQVSENAVRVRSDDGITVDVLAAIQMGISDASEDEYRIPSPNQEGWEKYVPEEQNRRIRESTELLGEDFKILIRLLKWWSRVNGHPISSHVIEIAACESFATKMPEMPLAVISLYDSIGRLLGSNSSRMPILMESKAIAEEAYSSWHSGQAKKSIELWGRLFGEKF
ncbi:SMODS domain-containing nucleotidyltransferase [Streptomyces microflavus]|uniref:SMODS domain-containing nucleotidyltransferase n=1 Tax=Streptomyces microflavus TaxID=1919 RepID=UPI0038305505